MNLLRIADLPATLFGELLATAQRVKLEPASVAGSRRGRSIGLFFAKPSVRTWVSCEVAAVQLGIHPVVIRNEDVGLGTRETAEDVGRVLERYLDLLGLRVYDHRELEHIADQVKAPVVNLLSDLEHPCQAIADLQTIAERRRLPGTVLAYVGDGNNVCNSLIQAAAMAEMDVRLACPHGYEPDHTALKSARAHSEVALMQDPAEAVKSAHVVYTDVWTSMGQESETELRRRVFAPYRVDTALFEQADRDAIFMHCLPAHRGEEVTDSVIEHPRSVVLDQAENRLHSFKAILLHLLS